MKSKLISSAGLLMALFATATTTHAQVALFADEFEGGNLDHWTGKFGGAHDGRIVSDPLNPTNHVLTFTAVSLGGDIFSAVPVSVDGTKQQLKLSFDFLALPVGGVPPPEYGGFAGVATDTSTLSSLWLAGTFFPELNVPPPVATLLATDGQWHHYSIDFTQVAVTNNLTNLFVVLEDWAGRGSIPGDVYFDNVELTAKLDPAFIAQLVPCDGPSSGGKWKNHGAYVSTMSRVTGMLLAAGLITQEEQDAYVSAAARSPCGKP